MESQKAELEKQINASREVAISLPELEVYIQLMPEKLNIKVRIDGLDVEITGSIPVEDAAIVTKSS